MNLLIHYRKEKSVTLSNFEMSVHWCRPSKCHIIATGTHGVANAVYVKTTEMQFCASRRRPCTENGRGDEPT